MPFSIIEKHAHPKHPRLVLLLTSKSQNFLARTYLKGKLRYKSTSIPSLTTAFRVGAAGLELSRGHLLENRVVECLVGHQTLQPRVLSLEFLEPLSLIEAQPAVLPAPAVVRLLADAKLLADQWRADATPEFDLRLAQLRDNLFGAVALPWHRSS